MQKRTRSILEELDNLHKERYEERDSQYVIESRSQNVITSAVRLIEQIESTYSTEQAEVLTRKLLNAIRDRDASKFIRSVRRANVNK